MRSYFCKHIHCTQSQDLWQQRILADTLPWGKLVLEKKVGKNELAIMSHLSFINLIFFTAYGKMPYHMCNVYIHHH